MIGGKRHEVATRRTGCVDQPKGTGNAYRSKRAADQKAQFWNKTYAMAGVKQSATVVRKGSVPPADARFRGRKGGSKGGLAR